MSHHHPRPSCLAQHSSRIASTHWNADDDTTTPRSVFSPNIYKTASIPGRRNPTRRWTASHIPFRRSPLKSSNHESPQHRLHGVPRGHRQRRAPPLLYHGPQLPFADQHSLHQPGHPKGQRDPRRVQRSRPCLERRDRPGGAQKVQRVHPQPHCMSPSHLLPPRTTDID